jgi:hypothetical protein
MHRVFVLACFLVAFRTVTAQDDLLNELSAKDEPEPTKVLSTFHGTRLINGHSVETKHRGSLEFIITHRFGTINSGGYNLWGLDDASIRLGLEYGITDRLGIGFGRSSYDKTFDYYAKYKLLEQQEGIPVTLTLLGTAAYRAASNVEFPELETADKMAYVAQLLIARKFSPGISLQLMPAFLHRAIVDQDIAVNGLFSLGVGGRVKITKSMALVGEYYARLNEKEESPYYNSIGFGVEFDTGGHVFQLVFTNSIGMVERAFLAETAGDFFEGDIRFGFNITRTFQIAGKK